MQRAAIEQSEHTDKTKMNLKDIAKWNTRMSFLYALGTWTMFGTLGYYQLRAKWDKKDEQESVSDVPETNQDEMEMNNSRFTSTIIYKENFTPYSVRISNYLKSFSNNTGDEEGARTSGKW